MAGEADLAMTRLVQNLDTGYRNFRWMRNDPMLAYLRNDPKFQRMVAHAN